MECSRSLLEIVQQRLDSDSVRLPVLHPIAHDLQRLMSGDDYEIEQVTDIIAQDQALASQILRVANSAFFSGLRKVSTIHDAIVRLGAKYVSTMVMLVTQENNFQSKNGTIDAIMKTLWKHSLSCAAGTKWLAEKVGYPDLAAEALLSGLMHDIGKLFLLNVLEDLDSSEINIRLPESVIAEVLDSLHAEQGYRLLKKWNLPEKYCVVARDHHLEDCDSRDPLLNMVRIVDAACRRIGVSLDSDPEIVLLALPEVLDLGVSEVVLAELEIMLEDSAELSLAAAAS